MPTVLVSGDFDDMRSRQIRLLQEAGKLGKVHVHLWPENAAHPTKFPLAERRYLLESIRYVDSITVADTLPAADIWVVDEVNDTADSRARAAASGLKYRVIKASELVGFPLPATTPSAGKKVIVTGCYDWFHSGHVRFFEEVSQLGDLYVVIGSDANVRLLKGDGHPLFPQDERRYVVGAVRCVKQCLISTGTGWLDAEPEIELIKPDIYAVNEDGDKPEKRGYCEQHGIRYVVLKRTPKDGLLRRTSTNLRGF